MDELRWALLLLGVIVILAVYVYTRRQGRAGDVAGDDTATPGAGRADPMIRGEDLWGDDEQPLATRRAEPALRDGASLGADDEEVPALSLDERPGEPDTGVDRAGPAEASAVNPDLEQPAGAPGGDGPTVNPEKIVAMRVAAREGRTIEAEALVLKLREQGLRHGRFSIFHRHADEGSGPPLFSVASMTEPGSFDLTTLRETRLPGVTLFMVLPGPGDPVASFEAMVATARAIAGALDGEVLDESGSTWSVQRERYVREELIQYRLQHPQRT